MNTYYTAYCAAVAKLERERLERERWERDQERQRLSDPIRRERGA